MQRVLSVDLWKAVRTQANRVRSRKAAIAYVTEDLIGFRKGDVLVVDAAAYAIGCGATDAKLLRKLHKKGVSLYHCAGLHAKVLLLDDVAVIGSGNMSNSSVRGLVEAGLMTDHSSTVAGIASFIEQLLNQSSQLQIEHITALCKIKVVRKGLFATRRGKRRKAQVARLGNQTWVVGVREIVTDPSQDEQRYIDRAVKALGSRIENPEVETNWVRWNSRNRFARECREGDSLIQIWHSSKAKRPRVFRTTPVLLKQKTNEWTRFYFREPTGADAEMPWGKFKRLLKELGYARYVGPWSVQLVDPDLADAIVRRWKVLAKS